MSQWTAVKDKLPEDGKEVLTFDEGRYLVLRFDIEKHEYNAKRWGKYFWSIPGQGRTWLSPTHWMYLPEITENAR